MKIGLNKDKLDKFQIQNMFEEIDNEPDEDEQLL
jgi:hypothetical protein